MCQNRRESAILKKALSNILLGSALLLLSLITTGQLGQAQNTITHQISLPAGDSWCADDMINGLFNQINSFRTQHGVAILRMDSVGMKDADIRATQFSAYMATHLPGSSGFNPHQGYDTTAASLGYNIISENLAFVTSDPVNIVYSIWQDSLHLAALTANDANIAGVSCIYANGIPYWTYEPGCSPDFCGQTLPPPSPTLDSEESAFLVLLNNYRAQNGAGPLKVSVTLEESSRWMSNDMASKNYVSHTDSLGRSTSARLQAFGYTFPPWGENIAAGYSDAASNFTAWQTACDPSPSGTCTYAHRQNMLNAAFMAIGIARAYSGNSAYGWYWTTDFGGFVDQPINPGPNPPPTIVSFSAVPPSITSGQASMLSWTISGGATSVTLDNAIGDVSGIASKSVSPSQTTTYTLTATNSGGSVVAHVVVTVAPVGDKQPPTPPTLISALVNGSNEVDLAWSSSGDNVAVTAYEILRNGVAIASVSGGSLSWADTNLSPNTTYTYAIKASDAAGNYSIASNSIAVTTPASVRSRGEPIISFFTATPSIVTAGQASVLSWSISGASTIIIDGGIGDVSNLTSKSVLPAQTTTYTLTASNNWGSAIAVARVRINAPGIQQPTAPTLISALAGRSSDVDLAWTASTDNAGVAGYQILRNGFVIATVPHTYVAWSDTTVSPNTTYSYIVKAYDAAGNYSEPSNSIQVTTPGMPPRPAR
jgi:uncharacterized protein YkwD/chitodextrinase